MLIKIYDLLTFKKICCSCEACEAFRRRWFLLHKYADKLTCKIVHGEQRRLQVVGHVYEENEEEEEVVTLSLDKNRKEVFSLIL